MSDLAIKVEHLCKRYRIGLAEERADTLVAAVSGAVARPFGNLRRLRRLTSFEPERAGVQSQPRASGDDIVWALRDVSFEVQRGEVIGVIGRNGAGKSTLLKILSRITEPTGGRATLDGRVASLLEVGTGFHPELTGRDNVYLNGTILGMSKAEVDRKFDEIVDFSGVRKFIDTPVKRYSSGMRVRLAFSVAAHLEPEILLIDEVLAVGDLAFQKKCLGKMGEVAGAGRTVLFVSHNMQMIDELCQRTVLLDEGQIIADGPTGQTLARYYELLAKARFGSETEIDNERTRRGTGRVRFTDIVVQDVRGHDRFRFRSGEAIRFRLTYRVFEPIESLYAVVLLRSGKTREALASSARHCISPVPLQRGQKGTFVIELPRPQFGPGTYPLYFWLGTEKTDHSSPYVDRRPFDVVDDLTPPLVVYRENGEPTTATINVESRLISVDGEGDRP